MSWQMIKAFKKSGLPRGERAIAFMLADHLNDASGQCNPSVKRLAEETGFSERHVISLIGSLEKSGHVQVVRGGGRVSSSYRLHPTPEAASPLKPFHPTSEIGSGQPCNGVTPPLKPLQTNHKRTTREPERTIKGDSSFSLSPDRIIPDKPKPERKPKRLPRLPTSSLPFRQSRAFMNAWKMWVDHRKSIGKPITKSAFIRQSSDFLTWGEAKSIEAIETAIKNGWTGLLDPSAPPRNDDEIHPPTPDKPRLSAKKARREPFQADVSDLPFQSRAFVEAWRMWEDHRLEIRKPLTAQAVKLQLQGFLEWGEAKAITAIENAIKNGWTGIYAPPPRPGERPTKPRSEPQYVLR